MLNEKNNGVPLTKQIPKYSDESSSSFHVLPLTN
ncbi:hypothetical protein C5L23_000894 [Leuconostoc fallax]|uniref:Uncharacterized protein n=1 Tax=Leuconostoc fallax TaxID=1251 RepID=A0A4R5NAB9_9LACO|nr:hypothetical protein C5L23_000894 [Leuconostoc fallax]